MTNVEILNFERLKLLIKIDIFLVNVFSHLQLHTYIVYIIWNHIQVVNKIYLWVIINGFNLFVLTFCDFFYTTFNICGVHSILCIVDMYVWPTPIMFEIIFWILVGWSIDLNMKGVRRYVYDELHLMLLSTTT